MNIHEQKILFVNAVVEECNRMYSNAIACKNAASLLPDEVKDLTQEQAQKVIDALPISCIGNVSRKMPLWSRK